MVWRDRHRRLPIVVALGLAGLVTASAGAEWSRFRGDAALTGRATESLPAELGIRWVFEAPDGVESTAAIVDGTVVVAALDGSVHALAAADGRPQWRYEAGAEVRSSPLVAGGLVYVGDEAGVLHALEVEDGSRRWSFTAEAGLTSSPNLAADRLLVGSYDQFLYALDPSSGEVRWKVETESYVHATPAIAGGHAYVGGCDGVFRRIRLDDGEETGVAQIGAYVAASAALGSGRGFVGTFENEVLAIDLEALEVVWRFVPEQPFPFYASPALAPAAVVVGGRDKTVRALDRATGREQWAVTTRARVDSSPVVVGERVFAAALGGDLYGLSLETGEILWQESLGGGIVASPSVGAGLLVVSTDEGLVYAFGQREEVAR